MTNRTFINICLLASIIPLYELWRLWPENYTVNPWLSKGPDISILWYVKGLGNMLADIVKAIIILRLSRMNQPLRIAAGTYLIYTLLDLWYYILDYNSSQTPAYVLIYSFVPLIIILFAYKRKQSSPYKQKELYKEPTEAL
jgi:hypothetical protein